MQGVILDEMRMYVVGAYGDPAWAEVMKRSGRPADHEYASDKAYPDQDLGLLALQAAAVSGKPVADILEGFGKAMVPDTANHYGVEVEITEEQCVLRGDPACVITVKGQ